MGSLRTIPGIVRGCSSDTRELTFPISSSAQIGILGGLGCDALIEAVYFRGTGRPTASTAIRLFRMRANSQVQDEFTPTVANITAGQWITDGFITGAGTGIIIGNGTGAGTAGSGTGTGTGALGNGLPLAPATKATMAATLTNATSGANSGYPRNNVIQATDQIGYAVMGTADATTATGATGAALTGATNVTVTIRFREVDAAALASNDGGNYVDG